MRLIERRTCGWLTAFIAVVGLALIMMPSRVLALSSCATPAADLCDPSKNAGYNNGSDCDQDGITDKHECEGFTTIGSTPLFVDGYNSTTTSAPFKLNPAKADLLYAVTDLNGTEIEVMPGFEDVQGSLIVGAISSNPNALAFYADEASGLKVSTHRINYANSGYKRTLFSADSPSKARMAWIRESLCISNCEGTYLGSTPQGAPSDEDVKTTIYSRKIRNNVYANCAADGKCTVTGTSLTARDDIVKYYILQVISHEMGHGSLLAPDPATAKSYYHYSRSSTVMDPSVTFSRGVYKIPVGFDPIKDPGGVTLVR